MRPSSNGDCDWAHHHVIQLLAERLACDPATISPSDKLSVLGFDSLDIVEIIMHVEDELRKNVPEKDPPSLSTVEDLINLFRQFGP